MRGAGARGPPATLASPPSQLGIEKVSAGHKSLGASNHSFLVPGTGVALRRKCMYLVHMNCMSAVPKILKTRYIEALDLNAFAAGPASAF